MFDSKSLPMQDAQSVTEPSLGGLSAERWLSPEPSRRARLTIAERGVPDPLAYACGPGDSDVDSILVVQSSDESIHTLLKRVWSRLAALEEDRMELVEAELLTHGDAKNRLEGRLLLARAVLRSLSLNGSQLTLRGLSESGADDDVWQIVDALMPQLTTNVSLKVALGSSHGDTFSHDDAAAA